MKKIILALAAVLLTVSVASAQVAVPQVATPQAPNPQEALAAKKADVEAKLKARQDASLQKIDEQIAKAKEAGKPTDRLEQKRQRVLERIEKHQERLNKRIEAQKAKLDAAGATAQ